MVQYFMTIGWDKLEVRKEGEVSQSIFKARFPLHSAPTKYFANDVVFFKFSAAEETFPAVLEVENFSLPERQKKFLRRQIKNLSIKITALAKYFASAE